jgi:arylformamidase
LDLSPTIQSGMPHWPTHAPVIVHASATHEHDGYFVQTLIMPEHAGAHVDAPAHIHPDMVAATIDRVALNHLIRPGIAIHLEDRSWAPGDYATAEDILRAERFGGTRIARGDVVLICFGWSARYFRSDGAWRWYVENSPGLAQDAAELLISRQVTAVGTDTASCGTAIRAGVSDPAAPGSTHCWLHDGGLRSGLLLLENLVNLEKLTARFLFLALPLAILGGSGSPVRAVAFVPAPIAPAP